MTAGIPTMTPPMISWTTFFQALRRQKPAIVHGWLRYWTFTDEGAALISGSSNSLPSLEKRQKETVLFLIRQNRWLNSLH
jgi:hypothetical protein